MSHALFLLVFQRAVQCMRICCAVALTAVLTACASAPAPDSPVQRFDAAYRTGSEKFAAGELVQAAAAFAQAERMAALYDRRSLRIKALFAIGAVAATREQDLAAQQAYALALTEAQGLADAHSQAVARAGLADVARRAGDLPAAQQDYDRALVDDALPPGSAERLQTRMGRALVWHATGQTAQALAELQTLEAQARAAASPVLASVLANQAAVLRDRGDLRAATAKAEEALAWDQRLSSPFALAADLELLGTLYRQSSRSTEAQASLERALRIVQATGQTHSAERLQRLLR
jgi:tetratricopeptide (TPR) repeat protein